ncbi:MAG: ImmA/IrrE family metallo-endopeptidase [Gammaproteobacteria bacterium]|nr:ImmA/IrrE family metallo-endopeptidase [Gammaproteobacteria bacterium]
MKPLGNGNFARKQGPQGLFAVVAQEDEAVHLHLRKHGARHTEKFAFARALGDVVCFPGTPLSAINNLHKAERQAVGRAFAAEFLAPVEMVLEMCADGMDIDEIARRLDVSPMVVDHQVENHAARVA